MFLDYTFKSEAEPMHVNTVHKTYNPDGLGWVWQGKGKGRNDADTASDY
jgi:hypothetical protein